MESKPRYRPFSTNNVYILLTAKIRFPPMKNILLPSIFPTQPIFSVVKKTAVNGTKIAWDKIAPNMLSKYFFFIILGLYLYALKMFKTKNSSKYANPIFDIRRINNRFLFFVLKNEYPSKQAWNTSNMIKGILLFFGFFIHISHFKIGFKSSI